MSDLDIQNIPPGMNRPNFPFPRADEELWNSILEAGFEAYPERKENYTKFKLGKRGIELDYLPVRLDIENVSRCNYHCTMCQVSDWPGFKRSRDMTLEEYKALLDEQYGLVEIKLQGMGEPFLGKSFIKMIEYARKKHIWVRTITNGSIIHLKENYKRVIDADVSEVHVSIDGSTDDTYRLIRRGGNLDSVKKNSVLLNDYARSNNRHRTRMWTVVQKENFHQLENFPKLASELGFSRLTLSLDLNDWGQENWKEKNDAIDIQHQMTAELANHLMSLGEKNGVEVTFWYMDKKYELSSLETLCPWPFSRGYISSEMKFVPCCMIANPDVLSLGDASNHVSIWNDANMKSFRKAHISGKLPAICKNCYA